MMKSVTSVFLLVNILLGVQQFSLVSADCTTMDCIMNQILSYIPFWSGSGYDDYYYYDEYPVIYEEIIVMPLTFSGSEPSTSGSEISPSTVPSSAYPSPSGSDIEIPLKEPSGLPAYDYGNYAYSAPSAYGSAAASASAFDNILGSLLGVLGMGSSGSAPSNVTASTNASAPSTSSPSSAPPSTPSSAPPSTPSSAPSSSPSSAPSSSPSSAPSSSSTSAPPSGSSSAPSTSSPSTPSSTSGSGGSSPSYYSASGSSSSDYGSNSGSSSSYYDSSEGGSGSGSSASSIPSSSSGSGIPSAPPSAPFPSLSASGAFNPQGIFGTAPPVNATAQPVYVV